jgi:L-aminopeptidase/D-esterase-like protein
VVFTIGVHVVNGLTALSQRIILPVWPDKVKTPLLDPAQTLAVPETEPPTVAGVIATEAVLAEAVHPKEFVALTV